MIQKKTKKKQKESTVIQEVMERLKTDRRAQEEEEKRDMDLNLEVNNEEVTHLPLDTDMDVAKNMSQEGKRKGDQALLNQKKEGTCQVLAQPGDMKKKKKNHEAQGILIPQPGIDPRPLQWKFRVLTTGLPGKSLCF